jgi:uncharacterized protein with HEPN domain
LRPRDVRSRLFDIVDAADAIQSYLEGMELADYRDDRRTRAAVEREFLTLGEALGQAIRIEPSLQESIADASLVIAFRHRLAHGYDDVSDVLVWSTAKTKLPTLRAQVAALLAERNDSDGVL